MLKLGRIALIATLGLTCQAHAGLILSTSITTGVGGFNPPAPWTDTSGNSLPSAPSALLLGQLYASQSGIVEFFYVGTEAGYTNSLLLNNSLLVSGVSSFSSTPGTHFAAPDSPIGAITVGTNQLLDFGFCTSGGHDVSTYGRCAYNDDAGSLIAQYNYRENAGDAAGYRSIGFRALTSYDPTTGLAGTTNYAALGTLDSDLWGIFWDDSGARNDDDYDDFIAVARYVPVSVPEPATALLLGAGLLGLAVTRRRASK